MYLAKYIIFCNNYSEKRSKSEMFKLAFTVLSRSKEKNSHIYEIVTFRKGYVQEHKEVLKLKYVHRKPAYVELNYTFM